jgi:3D (Asp-Asp-Asp) domain-containing protein
MKRLAILLSLFAMPCYAGAKDLTARLTVYWANGSGSDKWTRKLQSSTGTKLKPGHCAVDPRVIPYFQKVFIPKIGITLIPVDTGTDVRNKVASHGRYPIIDIFFPNKSDALRFAATHPLIVKVIVQ